MFVHPQVPGVRERVDSDSICHVFVFSVSRFLRAFNARAHASIYIYIWPFSVFKKFRHSLSATMRAKGGRRSCASFHLTSTPERHLQPKYGLLHAAQAGCLRCVKLWKNYGVDLRSASDTDNTKSPQLLRTDRLYQAVCHGVY